MSTLGRRLKEISDTFNIAILCSNQVSDYVAGDRSQANPYASPSIIPALGLAWTTMLTSRLLLCRGVKLSSDDQTIRRSMHVVLSPHLPNKAFPFTLGEEGIRGTRP